MNRMFNVANRMRVILLGLLGLIMSVSLAPAAIVVDLVAGSGDSSGTTFVYSNLSTTATFDGGAYDASTTVGENALAGASGSFTINWTPTSENDATGWDFDTVNGWEIRDFNSGWGASTIGDTNQGSGNLQLGEAFLLTFNTNNLTLDPGKSLVFSLSTRDSGDTFSVYQKTGSTSGLSVLGVSTVAEVFSADVTVDGANEFAVVQTSAGNLISAFRIDIVGDAVQVAVPDVVDLSQSTAQTVVETAGLVLGVVTDAYSDTIAAGNVISQNPLAGDNIAAGSAVDLVVSMGMASAPIQHLDATVAASVINSPVTAWSDLSGNNNDAVTGVGDVYYPSTSLSGSGLAGLDFGVANNSLELFSASDSEAWLDYTGSASGKSGFAVLIACKVDVLNGTQNDLLGNSTTLDTGLLFRLGADGSIRSWLGSANVTASGSVTNGDTVVLAANYNASSGLYEFWNSQDNAAVSQTVVATNFALADPVTIGRTSGAGRFLNGMIGEVKVYDQVLSAADFETETAAMVDKWTADIVNTNAPNIVLIYVDDWGWNGTPIRMDERMQNSAIPSIMEMPNLVSMAEEGMVFRNAYGSPQCSPARASVLTGQSNAHNGYTVYMNSDDYYDSNAGYAEFPVIANGADQTLKPETTTIPEALRSLGYATALYGKWHNRGDPEDEFGVGNAPNPPANYAGDTDANKPGNTVDGNYLDTVTDPKLMTWITSHGTNFMQQCVDDDKPFFLMLSHYAMHEWRECFPSSRARYQNIPEIVAYNNGKTNPADINRKLDPAVWFGMGYELDQKIGEVRQKLVDLGIDDNTYVVVVADNGYREEFFDELYNLSQPLHAHKWMLWQAGIRVPMIVTGPGIEPGSRCNANVVNYDFLPTFVEWGGGDPDALADIDGISLAGVLAGEVPSVDFLNRSLYFHYPHYRNNLPHSAIVKGLEKVVYFYETPVTHPTWDPIMYFDLANDAGEYHNLYLENQVRAQELHADMTNYFAQVGARIPQVQNDNYKHSIYDGTDTNYFINNDPVNWEDDMANRVKQYEYRVLRGPFVGTRAPEEDELGPVTFAESWMNSWGDIGAETNDFDHDGVANLMEYALGGNPTNELDQGVAPEFELVGTNVNYIHAVRNDDSGLIYSVYSTTNLVAGPWVPANPDVLGTNVLGGGIDEITNSIPASTAGEFFQLRVTAP